MHSKTTNRAVSQFKYSIIIIFIINMHLDPFSENIIGSTICVDDNQKKFIVIVYLEPIKVRS